MLWTLQLRLPESKITAHGHFKQHRCSHSPARHAICNAVLIYCAVNLIMHSVRYGRLSVELTERHVALTGLKSSSRPFNDFKTSTMTLMLVIEAKVQHALSRKFIIQKAAKLLVLLLVMRCNHGMFKQWKMKIGSVVLIPSPLSFLPLPSLVSQSCDNVMHNSNIFTVSAETGNFSVASGSSKNLEDM